MIDTKTSAWMEASGFDPDALDRPGRYADTALIRAAREGREDIVEDLLQNGVDIHATNMDGTNALWAACVADSFKIAQLLLDNGIDLNHSNANGATVLMYAASAGKLSWVEFLLARNVDITPVSLDGFNALELASTMEILKLLKYAHQRPLKEHR